MKIKLTKEQKTGLFALVTLIATYFLINFLKGQDFFNKNNIYLVEYENVEGLTPTGPVFFKVFDRSVKSGNYTFYIGLSLLIKDMIDSRNSSVKRGEESGDAVFKRQYLCNKHIYKSGLYT